MANMGSPVSHPNMREEAKDALRGLAGEPIEFYSDISNALHTLEDVARPAPEYVGVSLADADEAELVSAVFDAWEVVAQDLETGADDVTIRAASAWPRVSEAARAALEHIETHDRGFTTS